MRSRGTVSYSLAALLVHLCSGTVAHDSILTGYDADSSDCDEEGTMMSFSDHAMWRPILPDFWIIMKADTAEVQVFFHTR